MRILICVVLAVTMLSGCGQPKDFETMSDSYVQQELPQAREVLLQLPEDATKAVFGDGDTGTLYLCDSYCIAVQTIPSGNLDATLREVTGYGRDRVQLWERKEGEISRFVCVWVSAGEGGDIVFESGDVLTEGCDPVFAEGIMDEFQLKTLVRHMRGGQRKVLCHSSHLHNRQKVSTLPH